MLLRDHENLRADQRICAGRIRFPFGTGDDPEGFRDQHYSEQHRNPDGFHGDHDEIRENVSTNQLLLEEYIRF